MDNGGIIKQQGSGPVAEQVFEVQLSLSSAGIEDCLGWIFKCTKSPFQKKKKKKKKK